MVGIRTILKNEDMKFFYFFFLHFQNPGAQHDKAN